MKKLILTLLALFALTLVGCKEETKEHYTKMCYPSINTITYKGHDYIILSFATYLNGITHDPDCQCQKKGGENE